MGKVIEVDFKQKMKKPRKKNTKKLEESLEFLRTAPLDENYSEHLATLLGGVLEEFDENERTEED